METTAPNTQVVRVSMLMKIENGSKENLKRIEHHVEELLDLDSWPEIKTVYNVIVEDI